MFDVEFTASDPELQDREWYGLWGRVTLGAYQEMFVASIGPWQRADYGRSPFVDSCDD